MHRQRLKPSQADRRKVTGMDDLFALAPRPPAIQNDDEFWNVKIVQLKTGLSRATVYKYVELGLFPRQRHLGPGRVAWRASEVRGWIESRPQ